MGSRWCACLWGVVILTIKSSFQAKMPLNDQNGNVDLYTDEPFLAWLAIV